MINYVSGRHTHSKKNGATSLFAGALTYLEYASY